MKTRGSRGAGSSQGSAELREVKLPGCMEHTWVTAALGLSLARLKASKKLELVIWSQSFYIILPYLTFT